MEIWHMKTKEESNPKKFGSERQIKTYELTLKVQLHLDRSIIPQVKPHVMLYYF
jgi:hypothetical protein